MRKLMIGAAAAAIAFGIGATGAPGHVLAAAATWLAENGHVTLVGPVGEAVRQAL